MSLSYLFSILVGYMCTVSRASTEEKDKREQYGRKKKVRNRKSAVGTGDNGHKYCNLGWNMMEPELKMDFPPPLLFTWDGEFLGIWMLLCS